MINICDRTSYLIHVILPFSCVHLNGASLPRHPVANTDRLQHVGTNRDMLGAQNYGNYAESLLTQLQLNL